MYWAPTGVDINIDGTITDHLCCGRSVSACLLCVQFALGSSSCVSTYVQPLDKLSSQLSKMPGPIGGLCLFNCFCSITMCSRPPDV